MTINHSAFFHLGSLAYLWVGLISPQLVILNQVGVSPGRFGFYSHNVLSGAAANLSSCIILFSCKTMYCSAVSEPLGWCESEPGAGC